MLHKVWNARCMSENQQSVYLVRNLADHRQQLWHPSVIDLAEVLNLTRGGAASLRIVPGLFGTRRGRAENQVRTQRSLAEQAAERLSVPTPPSGQWPLMIIDVVIPRGLAVSDQHQRPPVVHRGIHGVRLEVHRSRTAVMVDPLVRIELTYTVKWVVTSQFSSPPESSDSQISLHSGQTGKRSGSRLGTHTLPQSATTGVPITIASVSFSLGT